MVLKLIFIYHLKLMQLSPASTLKTSSTSKGIKNTFHSAYNTYKNNIINDISYKIKNINSVK